MVRLLAAVLVSAAAVLPAAAQSADPNLSIDLMVAQGRATQAERDAFVRDYMASCVAQKAPANLRMTDSDLSLYCQCSAARATAAITAGDIAFMVANGGRMLSPAIQAKLTSIGNVCAAEFRERRAGQ